MQINYQASEGPEGKNKLNNILKLSLRPTPATVLSGPERAPMASQGILYNYLNQVGRLEPSLQIALHTIQASLRTAEASQTFSGTTLKEWHREIFKVDKTWSSAHVVQFAQKDKLPSVQLYTDSWTVANGLAKWLWTRKEHDWKVDKKDIQTKDFKMLLFHVTVSQIMTSREIDQSRGEKTSFPGHLYHCHIDS